MAPEPKLPPATDYDRAQDEDRRFGRRSPYDNVFDLDGNIRKPASVLDDPGES